MLTVGVLEAVIRLRDELTPKLKIIVRELGDTGKQMEKTGERIATVGTKLTTAVSLPLAAAGGAALKFAADFESSMTKVGVLTDVGAENIQAMSDAVLDLAPRVGIGPQELSEALTAIASRGLEGAQALEVLEESAKAAAVGLGDTKDVGKAVTSAMIAYSSASLTAQEATNKLFVAVRAGGAEASEFAQNLGEVVGIASNVGVSFDEVLASVATFTRLGVSASEAVTGLKGTLSVLLHPSEQARKELDSLGSSMDQLRAAVREKGLAIALTELIDLTKGNDDAIGSIIQNVRALSSVMGTAGVQGQIYAGIVGQIKDANTELDDAFEVTSGTITQRWNRTMAQAKVILIEFGDAIKPTFATLIDSARPALAAIQGMVQFFDALPSSVKTATVSIGLLATALGPVLFMIGNLTAAFGGLMTLLSRVGVFMGAAAGGAAALSGGLAAITAIGVVAVLANIVTKVKELGTEAETTAEKVRKIGGAAKDSSGRAIMTIEEATNKLKEMRNATDSLGTNQGPMAAFLPNLVQHSEKAVAVLPSLTQQFAAVERAVAALTPTQRANIAAGDAMGLSIEEIAKKMKLSEEVVHRYVDSMGDVKQAFDEITGANALKELTQLEGIWNSLSKEQKNNVQIVKQVVQRYDALRNVLGSKVSPVLEELRWNNVRLLADTGQMTHFIEAESVTRERQANIINDLNHVLASNREEGFKNQTVLSGMSEKGRELERIVHELIIKLRELGTVVDERTFGKKFADNLKISMTDVAKDIPNIISNGILQGASVGQISSAVLSRVGSAIGGSIGAAAGGAIGQAVGEAFGALAGLLADALTTSKGEAVANHVGRRLGVNISEGIGDAIAETADKMFGGGLEGRLAAIVFDLDKVIREAGGLSTDNIDQFTSELRNAFSLVETGVFSTAQAAKVLDKNFAAFVEHFKGGVISKELREIVALTQQFGVESQAVTKFLQEQAATALEGLRGVLAARKDEEGAIIGDPTSLERLQRLAVATFDAAIGAGRPFIEVIVGMQEEFERLGKAVDGTGQNMVAAFGDLSTLSAFFAANEGLADSITGTQQLLEALANSNRLTQQSFNDLAAIAVEDFNRMRDGGLSANQALLAQQETLQTIFELAEDGTVVLDEQTQALLEQAEAAGLVGSTRRSVEEQMLDLQEKQLQVLLSIADAFGADIPDGMRKFERAGVDAANNVAEAFNRIPRDLSVNVDSQLPRGAQTTLPGFAGGTAGRYLNFGAGTDVTLHGRERVMTEAEGAEAATGLGQVVARLDSLERALATAIPRGIADALTLAPRIRVQ